MCCCMPKGGHYHGLGRIVIAVLNDKTILCNSRILAYIINKVDYLIS
jgi:hypothetical protein